MIKPVRHPVDSGIFKNTPFEGCPIKFWWAHNSPWFNVYGETTEHYYYVPFNITSAYADWYGFDVFSTEENVKTLSHDLCHVLDLYIRGKTERLFQSEMGYGKPSDTGWSVKAWKNEANVLAMQNALLAQVYEFGDHYHVVAHDLAVRIKAPHNITTQNVNEYVEVRNDVFNYWKTNIGYLKNAYNEMCNWIKQHEYANKQVS